MPARRTVYSQARYYALSVGRRRFRRGRRYDPRFLSRNMRWGWACYNHDRVTARNFSRLFMVHRLNFEGDQVMRSRVDYGCSLHVRLQRAKRLNERDDWQRLEAAPDNLITSHYKDASLIIYRSDNQLINRIRWITNHLLEILFRVSAILPLFKFLKILFVIKSVLFSIITVDATTAMQSTWAFYNFAGLMLLKFPECTQNSWRRCGKHGCAQGLRHRRLFLNEGPLFLAKALVKAECLVAAKLSFVSPIDYMNYRCIRAILVSRAPRWVRGYPSAAVNVREELESGRF